MTGQARERLSTSSVFGRLTRKGTGLQFSGPVESPPPAEVPNGRIWVRMPPLLVDKFQQEHCQAFELLGFPRNVSIAAPSRHLISRGVFWYLRKQANRKKRRHDRAVDHDRISRHASSQCTTHTCQPDRPLCMNPSLGLPPARWNHVDSRWLT